MTDSTYNVLKPDNGVPIKAWTKGVPLEDAARQQLLNVAQRIPSPGLMVLFSTTGVI
jgi:hypothetical protein